jgi:hypothetical protein
MNDSLRVFTKWSCANLHPFGEMRGASYGCPVLVDVGVRRVRGASVLFGWGMSFAAVRLFFFCLVGHLSSNRLHLLNFLVREVKEWVRDFSGSDVNGTLLAGASHYANGDFTMPHTDFGPGTFRKVRIV